MQPNPAAPERVRAPLASATCKSRLDQASCLPPSLSLSLNHVMLLTYMPPPHLHH
jgi:hypothetical protein